MVNHSPQLFQRPLPAPAFRLLVIGDSQAAGVGSSSPQHSISGLFAAAHPDWSIETVARSGARLAEVTRMLKSARPPYDLILIFAGANDLIQLRPQFLIRRRLRTLLQAARPLAPRIAISHGGNLGAAPAFPKLISPFFTRRARTARRYFSRLCAEKEIIYLDLFEESNPNHASDGLHLNDAGYVISFRNMEKILANQQINE